MTPSASSTLNCRESSTLPAGKIPMWWWWCKFSFLSCALKRAFFFPEDCCTNCYCFYFICWIREMSESL